MNANCLPEKLLLRRCAQDDAAAQQKFVSTSYRNQVYKTAAEVNRHYNVALDAAELDLLCQALIVEIYARYETLPSWEHTLYRGIEDYVFVAVTRYLDEASR